MPGRAQSQGESHCVSCPRALFPAASGLLSLLPARHPLVAVLQAHTRPGALPVTPGSGLPTQSPWRAEGLWAPPRTGHYSCSFIGFWNVQTGRALGGHPAQPLMHDGSQVHKSALSFRPSDTLGSPGLEPWALRASSSFCCS